MKKAGKMNEASALINLLRGHSPYDETEQGYLTQTLAFLKGHGDVFNRTSFHPGHVTGSLFLATTLRDKILLIYHAKLNRWLQPGGHHEPLDANIAHTALRETTEETGISLQVQDISFFDIDVHTIPSSKNAPSHKHFDFRFLGTHSEAKLHAATDAKRARWVPLAETCDNALDDGILRMIEKLKRI